MSDKPSLESFRRSEELIAHELRQCGLDARPIDGWVYVALPDGRLLYIGAEHGQSLDATVYDKVFDWFTAADLRKSTKGVDTVTRSG